MKHIKEWIVGITALCAIVATATGYIQLPKVVEEVRAEADEQKEAIDEMANSIKTYVEVQKVKEEAANKRYEEQQKQYYSQQKMITEAIWKLADK